MRLILRPTKTCLCLLILLPLIKVSNSHAQNITSPYSFLGIGDIDTKDFGRYFGSGNASLARRNANSYNFSNPASLTALPFKNLNFDIATRGKSSSYTVPDADTAVGIPSNDFVVKRVVMALKVGKTTALAVGLKPYSSVNYLYLQDNVILDGNTSYLKMVEGSGGINQFYFSFAKEINKRVSIGGTAFWLFGSLERQTQYISPSISLNITKKELDFYTGAILQGGVQYYSLPGKKWRHQLGLVTSVSTGLRGELTTEYNDQQGSIKKDIETGRSISLPISVGLGYSAVKNDKLTLSVEANYQNWKYQKVNYANSYIYPSFRFSSGFEYAFSKNMAGGKYEKSYLSGGLNFENSYLRIENNNLFDYSVSMGLGRSVSRFMSLYTGVEIGNKGRTDYNQVMEKYTQFVIGLTLKQVWVGPRYSKAYD